MSGRGEDIRPVVAEETVELDTRELCRVCRVEAEVVAEWVREGVIRPTGQGAQWRFSARQVHRARTASRLQADLGVNTPGLALMLDLLEEVRGLRRRLAILERQLFDEG